LEDEGLGAEDGRASGLWRGRIPGDALLLLLVVVVFLLKSVVEEGPEAVRGREVVGEGGNSLCSGIIGCSIQSMFKPVVVGDVVLGPGVVVVVILELDVSVLLWVCSRGITADEEEQVLLGGVGSLCCCCCCVVAAT